jgi:hypothetical protein
MLSTGTHSVLTHSAMRDQARQAAADPRPAYLIASAKRSFRADLRRPGVKSPAVLRCRRQGSLVGDCCSRAWPSRRRSPRPLPPWGRHGSVCVDAAVLSGRRVGIDRSEAARRQFGLTNGCCQFRLTDMNAEDIVSGIASDDPGLGLRASLALHRLAERVEADHVRSAREKGWSWQQIGDALGVTRQSVHTKYSKEPS